MEENDAKPSDAAAAEGPWQPESSPGGGSGGGGGSSPGDADTGRRRALVLPAVLQVPGNHQHPHRITNFFIDNILRPEFGRRKDAGTCCVGAGGGRGAGGSGEGGAGGADRGGGAGGADQLLGSGREPRPRAPCAPGAGGPLPGGGGESPSEGEGGSKALSLHSDAKKGSDPSGPLDGALKARGLGGGDLSLSSDSDSSQASATLGAQPMLWPAWVYCTRYSDRPSSGEPGGPRRGSRGARAALARELAGEEDTRTPSPKYTKTHTATFCALPLARPRPGGRAQDPFAEVYRLLRTAGATGPGLPLAFRGLSAQPQPPSPWLEFIWWETGLAGSRPEARRSTPSPILLTQSARPRTHE